MYDFAGMVESEQGIQDAKLGEQNHTPLRWLGILGEEFGSICKAVNESEATHHPVYMAQIVAELVQVAAVCKTMYESLVRQGYIR